MERSYRFRPEDPVLLVDAKGRRYLVRLRPGEVFHSHQGPLAHEDIMDRETGVRLTTPQGGRFLALRPRLADFILEMPRLTQVIYPKDLGMILLEADVFPGATVVEGGMGSGALTLALLRAVGEKGKVISYEIREDLVARALRNIHSFLPQPPNLVVKVKDIYQEMEEEGVDRVVLDLPEPWRALPGVARALVPGGILVSYLPTILQVHQLTQALKARPEFDLVETVEVLVRPWHVTPKSVRPVHRMVAHTGFITTARRCQPGRPLLQEELLEGTENEA